jgi:demethylmenaquinone methyltransferase / 2-methoxy-6-polyprenyl-1,4-benzoquinol methylase
MRSGDPDVGTSRRRRRAEEASPGGEAPDHPRTQDGALPTGEAKVAAVRAMFDTIAPRYDLVNRIMTFGLDVGWRRQTVASLALRSGSTVLDLACGTGDLCRVLAGHGYRPIGVDLSAGMLSRHRSPAPIVLGDGSRLPFDDGAVDGATCGFALRNFSDLDAVLAELARVVRPGGRIALVEVGQPTSPLIRTGQDLWLGRAVPRIGAILSDADAYRYLPRSLAYLPAPFRLRSMLLDAGFSTVNRRELTGGIAQLVMATRSGLTTHDEAEPGTGGMSAGIASPGASTP